jgi:2-methylcitrate dehydratase PrpD
VWRAREAHAKLYPCAHVIHPFLDATRETYARHGPGAPDVEAVVCDVEPWQIPIVCEPREEKVTPRSEYQARASLPYCLAALLVDGRVDMQTFTPEAIGRPDVLALAARVVHREAAAARTGASPPPEPGGSPLEPGGFATAVEITLRDGQRLRGSVSAERVAGPEAVRAKFARTAGRRLPADRAAALAAAVAGLPATSAAELLARCTKPITPAPRDRPSPRPDRAPGS